MSEIGDVVILDVDANELRSPFNDLEGLPPDMVKIAIIVNAFFVLFLHLVLINIPAGFIQRIPKYTRTLSIICYWLFFVTIY